MIDIELINVVALRSQQLRGAIVALLLEESADTGCRMAMAVEKPDVKTSHRLGDSAPCSECGEVLR